MRSNQFLVSSTAQFRFEAAGALFDHVQSDLNAILACMGRFAHFPGLFHSPSTGMAKVAVAGASIPLCNHCGKQGHSDDSCWFLHIKKKAGQMYLVITKEGRERKFHEKGVKPRPRAPSRGPSRAPSPAQVNNGVYLCGARGGCRRASSSSSSSSSSTADSVVRGTGYNASSRRRTAWTVHCCRARWRSQPRRPQGGHRRWANQSCRWAGRALRWTASCRWARFWTRGQPRTTSSASGWRRRCASAA